MMETIFLFCFVFGALFTVVSAALGFAGSMIAHLPGGDIHAGHELPIGHGAHGHLATAHPAHATGHVVGGSHQVDGHIDHAAGHGADHGEQSQGHFFAHLPLFNVSSLLAFLTAFGATGFILMHFSGWSALWATPVALLPGVAADVLLALLLAKILAGERVMRPTDYELEGTIGRITVSVPAGGVGEILFSKGGIRRSEAARSLGPRPIPYDTEVVIVEYEHGTALVQPYEEFVQQFETERPLSEHSASGEEA